MDSISNTARKPEQNELNAWAERTLDSFGELAVEANSYIQGIQSTPRSRFINGLTTMAEYDGLVETADLASLSYQTKIRPETIYDMVPGVRSPLPAAAVRGIGNLINGALGVVDLGLAVNEDRKNGYTDMTNTIKTATKVTLQSVAVGATGVAVAALAGTAFAPAVAAGAIGLGAGYLAGKAIDGIYTRFGLD